MGLLTRYRNSSIRFKLCLLAALNGSVATVLMAVSISVYGKFPVHRVLATLCFLLAPAFFVGLLLFERMLGTLLRPLVQLTALARFVSVERDYSVRVTPQAGDEVGFLIDSFNEMLAQIQTRERSGREAEAALRESEERFALAAQGANDGLWDWKRETNRIYFSPRGNQMLGDPEIDRYWTPAEWAERIHPSDRERVRLEWSDGIRAGQDQFVSEYRVKHRNGTSIWVLSRARAVKDSDGFVVRVAGSMTDVTKDKTFDSLTGLRSRFCFLDNLESAVESPGSHPFAVVFMDLDRFKLVNDSLGHGAGDELLIEMASRLRESVYDSAIAAERAVVARVGADEFAVLVRGAGQEEAVRLAKQFLERLGAAVRLRNSQVFPGVSIGIALSGSGATAEDLLRSADTAMHCARLSGGRAIEVFADEMRRNAMRRIEMEAGLREAIENQQLTVFYQPQVEIPGGRIVGFEALVRWRNPERGLVQPDEFIPLAEETDLIIPVGRWVLHEACRQMANWHRRFDSASTISVNVSYKQLREPGFVDDVRRILLETGLRPQCLHLELTESTVMKDAEATAATLQCLKALHVGLEIDDFGTGYSSLSCLKRLPFDTVKIDRAFVRELGSGDAAKEIVRAILDLARSMGMTAIAEGVETQGQMEALDELGCTHAQGYFFMRPVEAAAATLMIETEELRRGFEQIAASMRQVEFASQEYAEISATGSPV